MPPPSAPVGSVWSPAMNPPGPKPRPGVIGPTRLHHANRSPGLSTVRSMIFAGVQIFEPKKLWSLTGNHVFHEPRSDRTGPFFAAISVVSFGAVFTTFTPTGAAARPLARSARDAAIAADVAL